MEDINSKYSSRRTLISTFFFSIIAGAAFSKSLELFYKLAFPVSWDWNSIIKTWTPFFIFISVLLRFYTGHLLHIKVLEQNPPSKSAYPWLYDFLFTLLELSILYFICMCFNENKINLFFKLLLLLLCIECFWIFTIWGLSKLLKNFIRHSIPWAWFIINLVTLICLYILIYKANLLEKFNSSLLLKISVLIIFLISAIADMIVTDRHFILGKKGWVFKEPED